MIIRKFVCIFLVTKILLVFTSLGLAQEGDPDAGGGKNAMCQGGHGIPGFRTAYPTVYTVPKIGGQSALYLSNALKAYRSGTRSHSGMMAIAASLSDQDIADLAAYYSEVNETMVSNKEGVE